MLAAAIRPIFNAQTGEQARAPLPDTVERLEGPLPKVATLLQAAEEDLLAFNAFPASHSQPPLGQDG
jgi:putative transposase